jgi:hypothetical protein
MRRIINETSHEISPQTSTYGYEHDPFLSQLNNYYTALSLSFSLSFSHVHIVRYACDDFLANWSHATQSQDLRLFIPCCSFPLDLVDAYVDVDVLRCVDIDRLALGCIATACWSRSSRQSTLFTLLSYIALD